MPPDVVVSTERFSIKDVTFHEARPPAKFHAVLGAPSRIVAAGPPAPLGHRNSQIHLYDESGLYLSEHHYTYLVSAATFVLRREESPFRTECDFTGRLDVGGILMAPGIAERDALKSAIAYVESLRGQWSFQAGRLWIGFDSRGRKGPSGRRGAQRYVATLSVCLEHNPWDTRFRPPSAPPAKARPCSPR